MMLTPRIYQGKVEVEKTRIFIQNLFDHLLLMT